MCTFVPEMKQSLNVESVNDYARYVGAEELHPLVSIIHIKGWVLLFSPELLHGTDLGRRIDNYHFFSYKKKLHSFGGLKIIT